jgi:putative transposase
VNVYPFVEAESVEGNVTKACALMEVSRSAYYQWHQHRPSPRQVADAELGSRVQAIFDASRGTYGWPRVHQALRREGICTSGKRVVSRVMRQLGLIGRCLRKKTRTTFSDAEARAADLLKRAFGPGTVEVDRVYVSDITYIWTWEGWLYLATVLDLSSRRVVGWAMADHMRASLVVDALGMALEGRRPAPGLIFHSVRA